MSSVQRELAGRGRRLAATAIDAVLVPALSLFLIMVAGVVEDAEAYTNNMWMLWVLLLAILSYLLLNGLTLYRSGQTLGKKALGIAMVRAGEQGHEPPSIWKLIFIRAWFFPLLFAVVVPWIMLIPLLDQLPIFGKRRRCLHDVLAGTEVVRKES
ncbi:MAG: RDD family protein [Pseudomonadales bacterium]